MENAKKVKWHANSPAGKLGFVGQLINGVILSEVGKFEEFPNEVEESVLF